VLSGDGFLQVTMNFPQLVVENLAESSHLNYKLNDFFISHVSSI